VGALWEQVKGNQLWRVDMQRMPGVALAFFVLGLSSSPTWAWSLDGHRIVGMIADILLANDQSGAAATQVLDGASLSDAATWADCAKGYCGALSEDEKAYVRQNPQHATYHYTDVPIQQARYQLGTAGTRNNDIVQVTKQAVNVLRGRVPNNAPAVLDRKSALWVMDHMVGDLHQPLHVGAIYFADDCAEAVDPNVVAAGKPDFGIGSIVVPTRGGNDLKLPNGKSFHVTYWDEGTVTGAMRLAGVRNKSIKDFANFIVAHPPQSWETSGDVETWPEQWATEILPISNAALTKIAIGDGVHADDEEGGLKCTWPVTITRDYTTWANEQALEELAKAGFRLAAVIRATM
jgi:S1/P1 Nuclease